MVSTTSGLQRSFFLIGTFLPDRGAFLPISVPQGIHISKLSLFEPFFFVGRILHKEEQEDKSLST